MTRRIKWFVIGVITLICIRRRNQIADGVEVLHGWLDADRDRMLMVGFLLLALFAVKGMTFFPSYGFLLLTCSIMDFWIGLVVAVVGQIIGMTISFTVGAASVSEPMTREEFVVLHPSLARLSRRLKWDRLQPDRRILWLYFFIPLPMDVHLCWMRAKEASLSLVLASAVPFVCIKALGFMGVGQAALHFMGVQYE